MELSREVQPIYKLKGYSLPRHRLTCSWPAKRAVSMKGRRIGECHAPTMSKDGTTEIYISPLVHEPLEVSGVVCHELIHAAVGVEAQHKGKFVAACKNLGLTKNKPTSAMPGDRLNDQLKKIIEKLGPYPHAGVELVAREVKRSSSGGIKLVCDACGCNFRLSPKWLGESGIPTCGCGEAMSIQDGKE
jgi:hypothetical protein